MSPVKTDFTAEYEVNGFLVIENLIPLNEVENLKQRATDIAEHRIATYPLENIERESSELNIHTLDNVRKLNACAENDEQFMTHAVNEKILDIVELLIGNDIKLFGSQMFVKPPGGVHKPYHQDSAYFTIEPMSLVTCWTALDNVTIENGCLWVIPGSHQQGVIEHSQSWQVGDRTDMQIPDPQIDNRSEVPIVMPAGSCSFHHSLLLHRSGDNNTTQFRSGLAVHYMSSLSRWTHTEKPQPDYQLLRGQEFTGCV